MEESKEEKYNQVPHRIKDSKWKSDKNKRKCHLRESQEVSLFLAGDHKAARNRQDSITEKHETQITKSVIQKKHPLGTII